MSITAERTGNRLLVVARHPFRLEDLALTDAADVESASLVRRPGQMADAVADTQPNIVLIDTTFEDGHGFTAMKELVALAPEAAILALTPDPPPPDHVAQAVNAGAVGFIDVDAHPAEVLAALRAVADGGLWLPPEKIRPVLDSIGSHVEMTTAERRSRLNGILIGLVPLTGLLAALMSFLWRRYTGAIGVRPVDIAVDPASRIVDALVAISLAIGVFGPLLFVGNWLDVLRGSPFNRGAIAWFLQRRVLAHFTLSVIVLGTTVLMALGPHPVLVIFVGPLVAVAVTARATDLSDQLPRLLRIEASPRRVLAGGVAVLFVLLGVIGGESLFVGPQFGTSGAGGFIAPKVLGFNAEPVLARNLDTDETRELLYLGGNADLYVLIDPCNDNNVEYVSVGSHKLEVIDEITCASDGPDEGAARDGAPGTHQGSVVTTGAPGSHELRSGPSARIVEDVS